MRTCRQTTSIAAPRAFTLIELTVVLGLIVLLIALAVPALSVITGARSVDGGINVLSAVIARARMDAIAAQELRGVILIRNKSGDRRSVGVIGRPAMPVWNATTTYRAGDYVLHPVTGVVFVARVDFTGGALPGTAWEAVGFPAGWVSDLIAGSELQNLPPGVDCQVIDEPGTAALPNDRLLSTGVIWFDGRGRLTSAPWALSMYGRAGQSAGSTLLAPLAGNYYLDAAGLPAIGWTGSGIGVVVYDRGAFSDGPDRDDADTQLTQKGGYAPLELAEENWVFANGVPLLVNRYNGTLVRAQ